MSNEFKIPYATGSTIYCVLLNAAGQIFNTSTPAFEAFNASHIANYKIACTEQVGMGIYLGNMPSSIAAGTYQAVARLQSGGSAAVGDVNLGGDEIFWSGTAEIFPATPGAQMDLVNAPNSTAIAAMQNGLATHTDATTIESDVAGISSPTASAIVAAMQAAGSFTFTISSPVLSSATIGPIILGDDYFSADNRGFSVGADAGVWPNLAGATVQAQFTLSGSAIESGTGSFNESCTITASGTGAQALYFELPRSVTAAMGLGTGAYTFKIVATLADSHVVTLVEGTAGTKT